MAVRHFCPALSSHKNLCLAIWKPIHQLRFPFSRDAVRRCPVKGNLEREPSSSPVDRNGPYPHQRLLLLLLQKNSQNLELFKVAQVFLTFNLMTWNPFAPSEIEGAK